MCRLADASSCTSSSSNVLNVTDGFRKLTSRGRGRDGSSTKQWEFQHPFFLREDKAAAKQIHRRTTADTEAIRSEGESMRLAVASLRNQLAATKKQLAEANRQLAAADAARQAAEHEASDLRLRLRSQVTARGHEWVADGECASEEQDTEKDEEALQSHLRGVVDRKRRRVAPVSEGAVDNALAEQPQSSSRVSPTTGTGTANASTRAVTRGQGRHPPSIRTPPPASSSSASDQLAELSGVVASTPVPTTIAAPTCVLSAFAGLRIASPQRIAPTSFDPLSTSYGIEYDDDYDSPTFSSDLPVLERLPSANSTSQSRDGLSFADSFNGPASALDVAALGLDDAPSRPASSFDILSASSASAAHLPGSSAPLWADAQPQQLLLSAVTPLSRVDSDRSVRSLASSVGSAGFAPTLGMSSRTELPAASMPGSNMFFSGQPPLVVRSTSVDSTGPDSYGRDVLSVSAFGTSSSTGGFPSLPASMAPPPPRSARRPHHGVSAAAAAAAAAAATSTVRVPSTSSSSSDSTTATESTASSGDVVNVARRVASMAPSEFAKTLSQIALAIVCSGQIRHIAPTATIRAAAEPFSSASLSASSAVGSRPPPVAPEEAKGAALDILRRLPDPAPAVASTASSSAPTDATDSSAAVVLAARHVLASDASSAPVATPSGTLPAALSHVPAELLMAALMRIKRVQAFVATAASGLVSAAAASAVAGVAAQPPQPSLRA